jgi:hypothetical protein
LTKGGIRLICHPLRKKMSSRTPEKPDYDEFRVPQIWPVKIDYDKTVLTLLLPEEIGRMTPHTPVELMTIGFTNVVIGGEETADSPNVIRLETNMEGRTVEEIIAGINRNIYGLWGREFLSDPALKIEDGWKIRIDEKGETILEKRASCWPSLYMGLTGKP